jgi:hypothetical protein
VISGGATGAVLNPGDAEGATGEALVKAASTKANVRSRGGIAMQTTNERRSVCWNGAGVLNGKWLVWLSGDAWRASL